MWGRGYFSVAGRIQLVEKGNGKFTAAYPIISLHDLHIYCLSIEIILQI